MHGHLWTDSEKDFIRQNAGIMKDHQNAAAISRITGRHVTQKAVNRARQKLGIRKRQGRGLCEVSYRPEDEV